MAELNQVCGDVFIWQGQVTATLMVFNPNHGFTLPLPAQTPAGLVLADQVARMQGFNTYINTLFLIYAMGYA
jgi:hypothetical protein